MGSSSIGILRLISLLLILSYCYCVEWDAFSFPNPTSGDYKRCNMRTTASICDPDGILTEAERYRLNHELGQLESRTRQVHLLISNFYYKTYISMKVILIIIIFNNNAVITFRSRSFFFQKSFHDINLLTKFIPLVSVLYSAVSIVLLMKKKF